MRNAILVAVIAALWPAPLRAQSWLPAAGQGSVGVLFQDNSVKQHLLSDGQPLDAGRIESHNVLMDVSYGVTDKIALSLGLPYVSSRYDGSRPHPTSVLDNGAYHGTMQDFRVGVRYGLLAGGVALTPFADLIVPSHEYDYYGHAAPGRKLTELQVGMNVGHVFTRGIPNAYVQGRYGYGFTEQELGISHNRSILDAELGYFINPRVRVFGLTASQYTYGGLPLSTAFPGDLCGQANPVPTSVLLSCQNYRHHDQLARANLIDVGAGGQFSLTQRLDVFASYATTVFGESVHSLNHGISIGVSWGLGKSGPTPPSLDEQTARKLPRCLCEKGKAP
jgi:hypothetical protein